MTRLDIATLSLRLAALYAWFSALELVASGVLMIFYVTGPAFGSSSVGAALVSATPALIFAVLGTYLFVRAPYLAHRFLPPDTEAPQSSPSSSVPATLAFGVVGLVGFLNSLPRVAQLLISLFQSEQFRSPSAKDAYLRDLPGIAAAMVQLMLCFALAIFSRTFAAWWERRQAKQAR